MADHTNSASTPSPAPQPSNSDAAKTADRIPFDEVARRRVIALLSNGSSRRFAARYVGCAPSTITRAAARDPQFAADLAHAEAQLEIQSLQAIRKAAETDRYWRAAAWLLERRNPADFGRKPEASFTAADVFQILAQVLASLGDRIPPHHRQWAVDQLSTLLLEFDPGQKPPRTNPKTPQTPQS